MQAHEDNRTLEKLIVDFCDEQTPTWTFAARVIGHRAAADGACLEFIRRRLAESPDAAKCEKSKGYKNTALRSDGKETAQANVHRFRHACCAMASYLCEPATNPAPFEDIYRQQILQPLAAICFEALRNGQATVGELKQIPQLTEEFGNWVKGQILNKQKNVDKFRDGGNPAALQANRQQLQALQGLTDQSQIPAEFRPAGRGSSEQSEWVLACYLAGVRTKKGLVGFPLPLLVRSLLAAAAKGRSAGLRSVLNLPQLLASIENETDPQQWRESVSLLCDNICGDWIETRERYNEYIIALSRLRGAPAFSELWGRGIDIPDGLAADLASLKQLVGDAATHHQASRLAGRIMRTISEEYFGDDWRWKERSEGEQFSLNVYTLLMIHGPGPLLPGRDGPAALARQRCRPKLQHRIALLLDGLQSCGRARSTILPVLVRCLKLLLRSEMAEFTAGQSRKTGSRRRCEAIEELMALCRRQLLIIKPLLADWLLPVTLRKDLAIIVCRILHKAYRQQEEYRHGRPEDRKEHKEYAVELIYIVLFAFPDNLLLREMIEYSTDDDICRLLDCIRQLIEEFERYDETHAQTASTDETIACFEPAAEDWKSRYRDFTQLLSKVSLHEALENKQDRWIDSLCGLVSHLARSGSMQQLPADRRDGERPLQPILLYGQKSKQHWQVLLDESKGAREDRTGAKEQHSEQESRMYLAARAAANRFEGLLDDISILENDCLPEAGRPRMTDDLVHRWRRLINRMGDLSRLCAEELPGLERQLCTRLINHRVGHELEPRLQRIVEIVDQEKEDDAKAILKRQVRRLRGEATGPADDEPAKSPLNDGRDAGLIQDWMLRRYMIRELAESYGLRVLGWLTNWRFILGWILLPFAACAVLHLLKFEAWQGVPFALICIANFALLLAFAIETRRRLPRLGGLRISPWRFLLPQTTAAIFLAIFSAIPSDEGWSLAVKANITVQALMWIAFLVVGFIFTREIILGNQFRGKRQGMQKNRRAGQLMAMSLWQSFTLVTFFAMAVGRIMAASDRGNINPEEFSGLSKAIANLLPVEVYLGDGFIHPATCRQDAAFWIYPRALISWTIQMFFFGAIFERIMGRSDR
ncbi:MAG: MFS transporter [Planctomycetota bacterium]|nr:MFS transporter [Planctomycetota bacterium]